MSRPKPDGGRAFPTHESAFEGMSLRDYIAAHALNGLFIQQGYTTREPYSDTDAKCAAMARVAYKVADAMLVERERTEG